MRDSKNKDIPDLQQLKTYSVVLVFERSVGNWLLDNDNETREYKLVSKKKRKSIILIEIYDSPINLLPRDLVLLVLHFQHRTP